MRFPCFSPICLKFIASFLVVNAAHLASAAPLGYVDFLADDISGIESLACTEQVIYSPDNKFSYSSSFCDDAINTFSRNVSTGKLTFVSSLIGNKVTGEGLSNVESLVMHPSGKYVFAYGITGKPSSTQFPYHRTIYVYDRDSTTGLLSFKSELVGSLMGDAWNMRISSDGHYLYVGSQYGIDVLSVSGNGLLTVSQSLPKLSKLYSNSSVRSMLLSADEKFVYVGSVSSNTIIWYARDPVSGALSYAGELQPSGVSSGGNAIDSMGLSHDGKSLYIFLEPDSSTNTVLRHYSIASDGSLAFANEYISTPASAGEEFYCPSELIVSRNNRLVYFIDGCADNLQVWLRDTVTGGLSYIGAEEEEKTSNNNIPRNAFAQINNLSFSEDGWFLGAAVDRGVTTMDLTANTLLSAKSPAFVSANESFSISIELTNNGLADAHEVDVELTGNGLEFVTATKASSPLAVCNKTVGSIKCRFPALPNKAIETIDLSLKAPAVLASPLLINLTKTQAEINRSPASDSLSITVQPKAAQSSSSSSQASSSSSQVSSSSSSVPASSASSSSSSSAPAPAVNQPSSSGGGSMGAGWLFLLTLFAVMQMTRRPLKNI